VGAATEEADMRSLMVAVVAVFLLTFLARGEEGSRGFRVTVLSTRPEMVTAGDALVRIEVPRAVPLDDVAISIGSTDLPAEKLAPFARDVDGHALTGVVDGLRLGHNVLRVRAKGGGDEAGGAALVLVNHPKEGPAFSGPRQTPFACETAAFGLPGIGTTLGPSTPPDCSAATVVGYSYVSARDGAFHGFTSCTNPPHVPCTDPTDVARATFTDAATGATTTVRNIVRFEVGTANRAIYMIALLHDPDDPLDPPPTFATRSKGWNGRLIYQFGTGCNGGWYRQGSTISLQSETPPFNFLPAASFFPGHGYAIATATLNNNSVNCNDVIAAETMMMVKERFIEAYGPPDYTIGFGLSGGAMQQHLIAENYTGLLDGIVPGGSFPDTLYAIFGMAQESYLLAHYFETHPAGWTDEARRAVTGFARYESLGVGQPLGASRLAPLGHDIDPTAFCPETLPQAERYDPSNNPGGVRCDIYTAYANVFGRDEETGLVRRSFDNLGVLYGLRALQAGSITIEQFLDLNENVGGFDEDGRPVPKRSEGNTTAIRAAYRTGRVTSGALGLSSIPIIDYRSYADDVSAGDAHHSFHTFSMRARLERRNGDAANQVILQEELRTPQGAPQYYTPVRSKVLPEAFREMDAWLARVKADTSADDARTKVVRARRLADTCFPRGAGGDPGAAPGTARGPILDPEACKTLYPVWSYPRGVAGEGIANDVIKCRLKPIDPSEYGVALTDADRERLDRIFPEGVCDGSKPGVGQQPPSGAWIDFGHGREQE
jgi:hypothetical protein